MQTLNQFKVDNGISSIDFLKGKGRAFANVKGQSVIIGSTTDLSKPLYVIPLTANKEGVAIPEGKAFVVVNNEKLQTVATL